MGKKLKQTLDAILGKTSKTKFKRIIILLIILGSFIFLFTNVGYDKNGFYLKPWDVEIKVKEEGGK
jgi:hypothetical protein